MPLQSIIPLLSYLCKLISWIFAVASLLLFVPVVSATVQGKGQSTLSPPSTDYWFFCTTRFNERPIALGLSCTHTHTHCSKSACHNSWYLSRHAMTLTDAEGESALRPGLMYIKWNAWLVLAPDFSRIQTMSRSARKSWHKSIELMLLRNLALYYRTICDRKPSIHFFLFVCFCFVPEHLFCSTQQPAWW